MNNVAYFTAQDVAYVRSSQAPQAKVAIAEKLGFHFQQFPRHSSTFRLAVEIAMLLQKDVSEQVRVALAESVASEMKTPATLATMLATDPSDPVAIPILKHSPRMADALLLPLIQATHALGRLMAIAERERLSAPACQALIEKKAQEVCMKVVELHLETLDGHCYQSLIRHYGDNRVVMMLAGEEARRRDMKLPTMMEVAIQQIVAGRAANEDSRPAIAMEETPVKSEAPASMTHDGSLLRWKKSMLEQHTMPDQDDDAWMHFVENMNREGALQAPTMLLAMGLGLMPLFAAGLARHSRVSMQEAIQACSGSEQDFRELYQRSHFPSAMYKLTWWTVSSAREQLARGMAPGQDEMLKSMARKLAQAEKLKINFARTVGMPVMEALLTPAD